MTLIMITKIYLEIALFEFNQLFRFEKIPLIPCLYFLRLLLVRNPISEESFFMGISSYRLRVQFMLSTVVVWCWGPCL